MQKSRMGLTEKALRGLLRWLGYLVYVMAVVFADTVFLAMLSRMFPQGILGTLAFIGALATGASMLLLPLAKMYWFRPGKQELTGYVFWGVELAVTAMNVLLAWQESLGVVDPWFQMWKLYGTAATPMLAMVGWFAVWATDPEHELRRSQYELETAMIERLREQYVQALEDGRVYEALVQGAVQYARLMAEDVSRVRLAIPDNNNRGMAKAGEVDEDPS